MKTLIWFPITNVNDLQDVCNQFTLTSKLEDFCMKNIGTQKV